MILGVSRRNCEFAKTLKKHWFLLCFVKVDLLKNNNKSAKNDEKSMLISNGKKKVSKSLEKSIWEGLGLNLEGFGLALGRLLVTFGRILLAFGRLKRYLFKALVQNDLQKAFWMDFGLLLKGFGKVFGRFWKDLGEFGSF